MRVLVCVVVDVVVVVDLFELVGVVDDVVGDMVVVVDVCMVFDDGVVDINGYECCCVGFWCVLFFVMCVLLLL